MGEREILAALYSDDTLQREQEALRARMEAVKRTSDPRIGLACVTIGLVSFGLVMILSVAPAGRGSILPVLAIKQLISVLVGTAALLTVRKVGYHRLAQRKWLIFWCALFALAPECAHCGCRVLGHGLEKDDKIFCCAHCASVVGVTELRDRA